MAKLTRKDVKLFAENCKPTLTTEFRTESADGSTASFSRDPDVIQNANFGQGWVNDDNNLNVKIFTEDLNSVCYVFSYFLKYLYENGIPEWKSTTTYYEHSIARVDNKLYISLQDNNLNYDPENTSGYWNEIPLETVTAAVSGSGSSIVKSLSGNNITFKSLSVDGYGSLQDDGDQINIHILGGSGIVDAFWGQIQGTLTNQTDLVSALGAKQDNLTFDTPLSKDVNNEVSIPKATDAVSGYLDSQDFATFAGKQDALGGFTHSYDTDTDTAQIYPTATNSNIGTSTYPITNVNASNVNANYVNASTVNSGGLFNLDGEINIRCQSGQNIEIGTDGSGLAYKTMDIRSNSVEVNGNISVSGTASTDKIQGKTTATTMQTGASIVPDTDNSYDLGSSNGKYFANTYAKKTYTNTIDDAGAGKVTIDASTDINGSVNITNQINMAKGQIFSWRDGGSAVAQFYTGGSGELTLNSDAQSLTTNCKINSSYGGSIQIVSAIIKDTNGNTVHIYPETRTDSVIIGNTGSLGSEYTGRVLLENNLGKIWVGNNTYSSIVYPGIHIDGNTFPTSDNAFYLGFQDSKWKVVYASDLYGTTHGGSCDRDKKENIVERDAKKDKKSSLKTINSLETYTFNYKEDKEKKTHIGIMAQDLREFEPNLILNGAKEGSKEEDLYVDIMGYCTLLTEAVKELSAKVDALEERVKELENGKEVAEK